jgi:hypothetical protein
VPSKIMRLQNSEIHLLVVDTASKSLDVVHVSMFWALVAKYLWPAQKDDVLYILYDIISWCHSMISFCIYDTSIYHDIMVWYHIFGMISYMISYQNIF